MKISIITLFPQLYNEFLKHSIIKRAQEKGLVEFSVVDHRKFGIGAHKVVDDKPYGGGNGMVLKVDVLYNAIQSAKTGAEGEITVLLDPQGKVFKQETAEEYAKLSHLILVCGHYEGFDERIRKFVDQEISIGDFILTGGEIPAMLIADAVTRLIPGSIAFGSALHESHSQIEGQRILEGPTYTRPAEFMGEKVPKALLTGDPKIIATFKKEKAFERTKNERPDLLRK